jgi:hypothetical protein
MGSCIIIIIIVVVVVIIDTLLVTVVDCAVIGTMALYDRCSGTRECHIFGTRIWPADP